MSFEPKRIAVFRMGHIGDTIIALPALWTVRKRFPAARILYFAQEHNAGKLAQGTEVLLPGTVFDEKLVYSLGGGGVSKLEIIKTLLRLRMQRIDTLIYLPSFRTPAQLARDEKFFRMAGIKRIIGMTGYRETDYRPSGVPLPHVQHEADILLSHLQRDGVPAPSDPVALLDLGLTQEERAFARDWIAKQGIDLSRPLVAIGPGSKMPAKLWPVERFCQVARQLDEAHEPTFLLFGSPPESGVCEEVARAVRHGINAAGAFTIRQSAAVLEYCSLYVGNDTGTMHIAAAAKAPCVAVFSARDWPGRWFPYGPNHVVHRNFVPCEGCMLEVCDKDNLCLTNIGVEQVAESALKILAQQPIRPAPTS